MACQETIEVLRDGTLVPRYKNLIGSKIAHKPRLLMQWGRWVCISHNGRGEGEDGTAKGAAAAYRAWQRRIDANERRHAQQRFHQRDVAITWTNP